EVCLKRQPRHDDVLIPFAGDEAWGARLAALPDEVLGDDPGLVGVDPLVGAGSDSFAAAVPFLLAVHATGEIIDARDRAHDPGRWAAAPPEPRPGAPYSRRAF